jgi:hypothetical protein
MAYQIPARLHCLPPLKNQANLPGLIFRLLNGQVAVPSPD